MGVPCMPVRTKCVVIGTELHDALGTLVPPGTPFTPSAITLWTSASTTYYGIGDEPVASVMICGEPAVNKGADTTYARPHMAMLGVAPPNVVVPEVLTPSENAPSTVEPNRMLPEPVLVTAVFAPSVTPSR